jgi:3-oxoadipate enol-lactonase
VPGHEVVGNGEPLLLLSGYALPASTLRRVGAALSTRFTCITFDYPGSGSTRAPLFPLSTPGLAASAVRLLERLGLDSAHVYGMSMGGLVAQELAIRFPERVRGLVLGATTPGGFNAARPHRRTVIAGSSSIRSLRDLACGVRLSGALYQGYAAMLHDTSTRLDHIQAKTLIIHGEGDRWVPVANAHALHKGIRGSSITILSGGSHAYAFDDPAGSAEVVLDWFEKSTPFPVGQRDRVDRLVEPIDRAMTIPLAPLRAIWRTGRRALISGERQ